ncbi:MAG: DUF1294 domain-containing protein [Pseudomonas sp.]|nr:DUF1294 domain-containing protein [Pseudomonas sp.]
MEQQGILRSWNDDKGFGFIRAEDRDFFVHISSVRGERRPLQGEAVYFVASKDEQGRLRAQHMRSAELSIDRTAIRRKPTTSTQPNTPVHHKSVHKPRRHTPANLKRSLTLLIGVCAIPAVGTWQVFVQQALIWPLLAYLGMSLLSIWQYSRDKHNAQTGAWRTPEKQLHAVELLGGWPGALLAQQLLRHKTKKASYQGVFWLIVLVHQVYWLDQLGWDGQLLQQLLSMR